VQARFGAEELRLGRAWLATAELSAVRTESINGSSS
jgi:hypothetical protein